jgi:coenzyme F420-0:L-glutamate ligase/coenzyme F420-1:gamma-L-glutamate ligase
VTVEIIPVPGIPEVRAGDDLVDLVARALRGARIEPVEGDVVVVTQKVVSKAEGRLVPEQPDGKQAWVARETRRVVARRGEVLIAETRHGFVCANAGVDASNVPEGFLSLLPEDPDDSADRIRKGLETAFGTRLAVVVTDTFGRPWRAGLVNVAIGCAGLPSLVDLRGEADAGGRVLEVTVQALADEVAAASGLVMGKSDGVPVAIVRGVDLGGLEQPASAIVRPPQEDLFRESPLEALRPRPPVSEFGRGEVSRPAVEEAVRLALAGREQGESTDAAGGVAFVVVGSRAPMDRLARSGAGSDGAGALATAAVLIVAVAGRDRVAGGAAMAAGAAVERFLLALRAQGLASRWFAAGDLGVDALRGMLALPVRAVPLGVVAAGPPRSLP